MTLKNVHVKGQKQKRTFQRMKRTSPLEKSKMLVENVELSKEIAFQDLLVNLIVEIFHLNIVSAKISKK